MKKKEARFSGESFKNREIFYVDPNKDEKGEKRLRRKLEGRENLHGAGWKREAEL